MKVKMKNLRLRIKEIFTKNTIEDVSSTGKTGEHIIIAPFEEMIDDIVSAVEQPKTFEDAVEPIMKWLSENQHPHTAVIVTSNKAELFEGVKSHLTDEFIVD